MFVARQLVFVELHKTGSTHICKLLALALEGRQLGKHNRPDAALLASGRSFVGSVRCPWAWYLSLWRYGCAGKGGLHRSLTAAAPDWPPGALWHPLATGRRWLSGRDPQFWRELYADGADAAAFRRWLVAVHDPQHRWHLGLPYALHPASRHWGVLTVRFLALFCRGPHRRWRALADAGALGARMGELCYINHFVRTESLVADLLDALAACGVPIDAAMGRRMEQMTPSNTSGARAPLAHWYDSATVELVARREAALIKRFGWQPPIGPGGTGGVLRPA